MENAIPEKKTGYKGGGARFGIEKPAIPGPGRPKLSDEIKAERRDAREILKAAAPRMAQRIVELCESAEDDTAIKALRVGLDKVLPDLQEGVMQIEHTELEPLSDKQLEKRLALARSIVSGTRTIEHNGAGNGKANPS